MAHTQGYIYSSAKNYNQQRVGVGRYDESVRSPIAFTACHPPPHPRPHVTGTKIQPLECGLVCLYVGNLNLVVPAWPLPSCHKVILHTRLGVP